MSTRARALAAATLGYGIFQRHKNDAKWIYDRFYRPRIMPYRRSYRSSRTMRPRTRRRMYKKRTMRRVYKKRRYAKKSKLCRRSVPSTRQKAKCVGTDAVATTFATGNRAGGTIEAIHLGNRTSNHISVPNGQLYTKAIPYPDPVGTANTVDARRGNAVYISGVKIDRTFSNTDIETDAALWRGPIVVHWCLMQPKDLGLKLDVDKVSLPGRFFRDYSDKLDETANFTSIRTSDPYFWDELKVNGTLNPDNGYKIITHQKKILTSRVPGNYSQGMPKTQNALPHVWHIKRYYKYCKVADWQEATDVLPQRPLYEVWWWEWLDNINSSNSSILVTHNNIKTYYRNLD